MGMHDGNGQTVNTISLSAASKLDESLQQIFNELNIRAMASF
jgi:hypothetical protein